MSPKRYMHMLHVFCINSTCIEGFCVEAHIHYTHTYTHIYILIAKLGKTFRQVSVPHFDACLRPDPTPPHRDEADCLDRNLCHCCSW